MVKWETMHGGTRGDGRRSVCELDRKRAAEVVEWALRLFLAVVVAGAEDKRLGVPGPGSGRERGLTAWLLQ